MLQKCIMIGMQTELPTYFQKEEKKNISFVLAKAGTYT